MSGRFDFDATSIEGLTVLQRKPKTDARGFLERLYCADEWKAAGLETVVHQVNRTLTRRMGTLRGLHFQWPPMSETKIVTCLKGRVYDVVVDLRANQKTYLQWYGLELDAKSHRSIVIPAGFAHGFQTLEPDCEMLYLHDAEYAPDYEDGLNALDPLLGIVWPQQVAEQSDRDRGFTMIEDKTGAPAL